MSGRPRPRRQDTTGPRCPSVSPLCRVPALAPAGPQKETPAGFPGSVECRPLTGPNITRQTRIQRLRSDALHFFDTNLLIRPEADLPPLRNVPLQSRWITETVRQEVSERGGTRALESLDRNFRTLTFKDLYAQEPRVCPVFYWYVLSMYNPATVGSQSFIDDLYESKILKNTVTSEDQFKYQKIRSLLGDHHAREASGRPGLQRLEQMSARLQKKARRSLKDRHPAYIRDIKSIGLAIYYGLSSRRNTVYYTSDSDPERCSSSGSIP